MIGKALKAIADADTDVNDLVDGRFYPQFDRDNERPSVIYDQTGCENVRSYTGRSGLQGVRAKVTAVADTYAGAIDLANKLREALDDEHGTFADVVVQRIFVENEDEDAVLIDDGGGDVPVYGKSLELLAWITH
jgi:hypothetical protein